jgi:hypothetical protein
VGNRERAIEDCDATGHLNAPPPHRTPINRR